jgi:hypothetical protein
MSIIGRVTAHYNLNRQQFIDVPEWGENGTPLRVYWRLLTIEQREKLFAMQNRTDVDILIAMATDADGKPLFDKADKPELRLNADAAIITRIATRMLGADRVTEATVEQAEKN